MPAIIIALTAVAVLIGGPAVYFLSSPDREVGETFSSFSFKNDAVERPAGEGEEGGDGEDESGSGEDESSAGEEEWDWETGAVSGTDSTSTGGGSGPASSGSGIAQSGGPGATTGTGAGAPGTGGGQTGGGAGVSSQETTSPDASVTLAPPPTFAPLSITSPQGGNKLINKSCPTNSETVCYESPIATIFWSYGDPTAKITIVLTSKSGTARTLATKTSNSGRYTWSNMPTLPDGEYKLTLTAYSASGATLSSAETGFFTVNKEGDAKVTPAPTEPAPTLACPPVPSKVRTYTKTSEGMSFYCTPENGGCVDQVTLKHYRYPETLEIGEMLSLSNRCALTATPGSRTCPYTYSNYPSGNDANTYSIMTREPDPLNDPNEIGDRRQHAYLKPIIGPSRANDAFDMSIPFKIKESEEGETFDFRWHPQNQSLIFTGQFSISECEGDYSERSIWVSSPEDIWNIRASVLATDGLEGAKFISGISTPVLALKAGKTYYFNLRWLYSFRDQRVPTSGAKCFHDASGNCTSPFVRTDDLPDSAIHAHALWRQLAADPSANYLEFYRMWVYQYNFDSTFGQYLDEDVLEGDPLFDRPGGVMLNPYMYYPACQAVGGQVHNGVIGSDCRVICKDGYRFDGERELYAQCVRE